MRIADICVKYPVFTVMLIAFLVTLGAFSYRGLAFDLFPKADPATVNVGVKLPGATPEEVITGVVLPLEDAISSVSGIDEITVYSSEGFADITCTFVLERDIEGAAQDIREKVSAAISRLPRDTLPPVITKQDPQSDPILTLLVSGPMSRRELTEVADKQVRRAIQTVDGVGSVDINGGQERQIRVLLDAQKLTSHNFTVLDVRDALQRENIEAPGGRMITGPQQLGLRTMGRVNTAEQFGEIVIGTRGTTLVRVRDVAQVEDGAQELLTWSALFRGKSPGQDVIAIDVRRQSGVNTVQVAENVKTKIEDLRAQMPPGVQLLVIHDISDFIKASVNSLLHHRHLHAHEADGLFTQQYDSAGAHARRRHRHRRRHHRSRKHRPFHGRKRCGPQNRGHRRYPRNRPRGHGHYAFPGHHLFAHRLHERLCPQIRELLWLDYGHGHSRIPAHRFHAHADDEFAHAQAPRQRKRAPRPRIPAQNR